MAYPDPYHSSRVYLPEGNIEKIQYELSISDGFINAPYALIVADAVLVILNIFLIDDDETPLIDDDEVFLIEDPIR